MTVTFSVDEIKRDVLAKALIDLRSDSYEEPVNAFVPFDRVKDNNPGGPPVPWTPERHTRRMLTFGFEKLGIKNIEARKLTGINRRYFSPQENGFVKTIHYAYNYHYPLTLDPDTIWLVTCQAVARHIELNPEDCRKAIVNFEGKKTLTIRRDTWVKGSPNNDWEGGFAEFSEQIAAYIGKKRDLFDPTFTTTTPTAKAATQVQMMAALAPYFDYRAMTCCGIPTLTLLGTVDDWKSIKGRVQAFREFYPAWAADPLENVLDEFIKASEGSPNVDFWKSFFKDQSMGSGGTPINGYINAFFPYMTTTKWTKAEGSKEVTEPNRMVKENLMGTTTRGYELGDYRSAVAAVPLTWDYYNTQYKMKLAAGCFGYWVEDNSNIRPVLGWAAGESTEE